MPSSDNRTGFPQLRAYIRRAGQSNGYTTRECDSLVNEVFRTLEGVAAERNEDDLFGRIENRLREPKGLKDSEEYPILRDAIKSLVEPRTSKWIRNREELPDSGICDTRVPDGGLAEILAKEELSQRLRQETGELPEQLRQLVHRVYWDGLTQAEYGREIGRDRRRVNEDNEKAVKILEERLKSFLAHYQT